MKTKYISLKILKIINGKADTIYSALSNVIEKCGGVGFGSDWVSVIIVHKKVDLSFQNPFFLKESTFLMKNNYLICQFYCLLC